MFQFGGFELCLGG